MATVTGIPADDIRQNMRSFGWDLTAWERAGKFAIVDASPDPHVDTVESGSFDLSALLARVQYAVTRLGATRVALDSLGAFIGPLLSAYLLWLMLPLRHILMLVERMGLRRDVVRLPITELGCAAGAAAGDEHPGAAVNAVVWHDPIVMPGGGRRSGGWGAFGLKLRPMTPEQRLAAFRSDAAYSGVRFPSEPMEITAPRSSITSVSVPSYVCSCAGYFGIGSRLSGHI